MKIPNPIPALKIPVITEHELRHKTTMSIIANKKWLYDFMWKHMQNGCQIMGDVKMRKCGGALMRDLITVYVLRLTF